MPAARLFPDSNRTRGFQVTWGGYLWVIAQVGRYPDAGDLADSVNVYTMIEASVMGTFIHLTLTNSSKTIWEKLKPNSNQHLRVFPRIHACG